MNKHWDIKKFLKNNTENILPLIHFLLTFVWERIIFDFSSHNSLKSLFGTVTRNNYISDQVEFIIVYTVSKIFAGLLIWFMWKLIFKITKREICKIKILLFGIIFLVGVIIGIFSYPSTFALEIDNYINYLQAIHFFPTYWHSIYTGVIYAGCMLVIPHPFSIFVFQWLFFIIVPGFSE